MPDLGIGELIAGIGALVGGGGAEAAGAGALAAGAGEAAAVGAPLAISDVGAGFLAGTLPAATAAETAAAAGAPGLIEAGVLGSGAVGETAAEALGAGAGALSGGFGAGAGGGVGAAADLGGAISPLQAGVDATALPSAITPTTAAAPGAAAQAGESTLAGGLAGSPLSNTLPSAGALGSGTSTGSALASAAPSSVAGVSGDVTSGLAGLPDVTSEVGSGTFASLPAGGGAAPDITTAGIDPFPTGTIAGFPGTTPPADPGFFANLGQGNFSGAAGDVGGYLAKNPMLALGPALIGGEMLLGNKQPPGQKAVKAQVPGFANTAAAAQGLAAGQEGLAAGSAVNAAADRASGLNLQSYLTSGQLPPGIESKLTSASDAAEAAIRGAQSNVTGGGYSSAEAADLQNVQMAKAAQASTIATSLWNSGLAQLQLSSQETGQATGELSAAQSAEGLTLTAQQDIANIYSGIMQTAIQQDAALGQAVTAFASAAALTNNRGGTTIINQQPQQAAA